MREVAGASPITWDGGLSVSRLWMRRSSVEGGMLAPETAAGGGHEKSRQDPGGW
jgi:hypothetical protein